MVSTQYERTSGVPYHSDEVCQNVGKTDRVLGSADDGAEVSRQYGQLAFILLASLGLLLAAMVAPPVAEPGTDTDDDPHTVEPGEVGEPPDDTGDGDGFSFDLPEFLYDLIEWTETDGEAEYQPPPDEPACVIVIEDRNPVPGDDLSVAIIYEDEPLVGAHVWFDDNHVGTTDDDGRVTGQVPYEREFDIRAQVPGEVECTVGDVGGGPHASGVESPPGGANQFAGTALSAVPQTPERPLLSAPASTSTATGVDDETANTTVNVEVAGEVDLRIDGEPFPGEELTLWASIEGQAMANAIVRKDGDHVETTDEQGEASLVVPDDGSDSFELTVERGAFDGTTTVDVLLLDVALEPDGLAVVPGATDTVVTTVGDDPIEGATVTVGDREVGTTDENGTLAVETPVDPRTTIAVTAVDQTATTSVFDHYRLIGPLAALLVSVLSVLAYWVAARRGLLFVWGATVAALTAVVAEAYWGTVGLTFVLGSVAVVTLASVAWRGRNSVAVPEVSTRFGRSWLREILAKVRARLRTLKYGLKRTLLAVTFRIVDGLERVVAWLKHRLGVIRAWLESLPRSGSALLERFLSWGSSRVNHLQDGIGRDRGALVAGIGGGGIVLGVHTVAHSYAPRAWLALGGVSALVLVAGAVAAHRQRADNGDEAVPTTDDSDLDSPPTSSVAGQWNSPERTLRECWRSLARWTFPSRWRTRTPAEVVRKASELGYPAGPVDDLAMVFRDVEYGGRRPDPAVHERANEAYQHIARHRTEIDSRRVSSKTHGGNEYGNGVSDEKTAPPDDQPVQRDVRTTRHDDGTAQHDDRTALPGETSVDGPGDGTTNELRPDNTDEQRTDDTAEQRTDDTDERSVESDGGFERPRRSTDRVEEGSR